MDGGQVGSEVYRERVRVGRDAAKVGRKWANFGGAGADRIPIPCTLDENSSKLTRTGIGGTMAVAFGVNKEILVERCEPRRGILGRRRVVAAGVVMLADVSQTEKSNEQVRRG
jgi:hypothetical protein